MSTVLVGILVLLAILIAGVRVVGLTPFAVLSGSMEPTYPVGSLIYVKSVASEEISAGMPLTYAIDEKPTLVTHRVVEVSPDGMHYYTQGDANDTRDGKEVSYEDVVGTPVFMIPYLGYISTAISQPPGCWIAITGVAVILVLMFTPDLLKKAEEADRRDAAEKQKPQK